MGLITGNQSLALTFIAILAALVAWVCPENIYWPNDAKLIGTGMASLWAISWAWRCDTIRRLQVAWTANRPWVTTPEDFCPSQKETGITMGIGFPWNAKYTQILENFVLLRHALPTAVDAQGGHPAFHAVGQSHERLVVLPWSERGGHVLITGTTGSGKTRILEAIASESIRGPGAVVIIDPKGERDLWARCAERAAHYNKPFKMVLAAYPASSGKMNVLETATTTAEVSTRIRALMPSGGGLANNPFFEEYPLALVERVAAAQAALGIPWTLEGLYGPTVVPHHMETLVLSYLRHLGYDESPGYIKKGIGWYRKQATSDSIADGLINDIETPRDHVAKVASNLIPAFRGVIGEPLGPLFSATPADIHWRDIVNQSMVLYISLASLLLGDIANRVGRVILQDLIGFIGRRYAFDDAPNAAPITVIIDEFGDVTYPLFINALNKSRGANIAFVLAQQSTADPEAVLGKANTRRIHDNLNTRIWCRLADDETATIAAEGMGKCMVTTPNDSVGVSYGGVGGLSGSSQRHMGARETDLVKPKWLTSLPKGHTFVTMKGEVWKMKTPMFSPVLKNTLHKLGLEKIWKSDE